jgi:hypothetical protein
MKKLIGLLIILSTLITGAIFGGAYTQKKLADKFDMVQKMVEESDRLTVDICRYILQENSKCEGDICA